MTEKFYYAIGFKWKDTDEEYSFYTIMSRSLHYGDAADAEATLDYVRFNSTHYSPRDSHPEKYRIVKFGSVEIVDYPLTDLVKGNLKELQKELKKKK